jgi:tight adherence protein B
LITLVSALAVGLGLVVAFDGLTRPLGMVPVSGGGRLVPIVAGVVGAATAFALTGWPVAALAGVVAGLFSPRLLGEHRSASRRIETTDALAEAAAGLRDAVRGGLGINDGLTGLATWGPPRLRRDIATLASESGRLGLDAAAKRFAGRMNDPGADLLAATLAFNDRVGGRQVAEVLDAMAEELAAEARTVRELRARQSRQRTSARIVALAPAALLLALRQINPGYLEAYDSPTGQIVLGAAAMLIGLGYAVMLRIARGIEPPRVLAGGDR